MKAESAAAMTIAGIAGVCRGIGVTGRPNQRRTEIRWQVPANAEFHTTVEVGKYRAPGSTTVGDIMAFQWYTLMLLEPVWAIVNSFSELQRSLAGMERVFEVIESPVDKPDKPDAIDAPSRVEDFRFEHVDFAYSPGEPVIKDFDLAVTGGSVVALVGRSGAGKTNAIKATLEGPITAMVPATIVQLHRHAHILVDEAAAAALQYRHHHGITEPK